MADPHVAEQDAKAVRTGQVLNDFLDRRSRGEPVSQAKVLADHPDLAGDLRRHFEMLGDLHKPNVRIDGLIERGMLAASTDTQYAAELGPYKILRCLGRGGMGIVLEAYEESLDRRVALKILRPELAGDGNAIPRFTREAKAAAALEHPNIVRVYAVGQQRGAHYLAMEFVDGPTLAELIRAGAASDDSPKSRGLQPARPSDHQPRSEQKKGRGLEPARPSTTSTRSLFRGAARTEVRRSSGLPTNLIRPLFRQLLNGLAAAHDAGLIHRDIKSANLLLECGSRNAECGMNASQSDNASTLHSAFQTPHSAILKIADFGLARMVSAQTRLTLPDATPGTPEYMSPEQARGDDDIDHRSDLYSAGVVLYEMLTGRTPFRADTPSAVLHRILHDPPPDPRSINNSADPHLSTLALRLMAKRPEDRFASANDVLAAVAGGGSVLSLERRRKRRRLGYNIVAVLSLAAVFAHAARRPDEVAGVRVNPDVPTVVEVRYAGHNTWESLHEFGPDHLLCGAALIDADGEGEQLVVAALQRPMDGKHLFAFDADGNEAWSLELSSKRHWQVNESTVLSSCTGLVAANCDRRPGEELILSVVDAYGYRSRILIVDPRTQQIRSELWHMGHIAHVLAAPDFLGVGRPAIIAHGMNNHLAYITHQRNGKETPLASFMWVPAVMVLAPEDLAGEQLLAPHMNSSRLDKVPTVFPRAYACLDRAPAENVKDVSGGPGCVRMPESSEVASPEPVFLLPCPKDSSKSCIMLPFSGAVESKGGANLLVESNLVICEVRLSTAPWEGQDEDYWRRHWRVIIQNGEYVEE